jgi:uncharacterized protein YsxB (DUF464 family)
MTNVTIHKRQNGQIVGYRVKGHSGYAEHGSDIICAALSTLSQATVLGLKTVVGVKVDIIVGDADLQCYVRLQSVESKEMLVDALMRTFYETIKVLTEDDIYSKYIKLSIKNI